MSSYIVIDYKAVAKMLEDENAALKREVRHCQDVLERKNRLLDALHCVWCNGGCESGTHRWSEKTITEEVVQDAERNTMRLRQWFEAAKSRRAVNGNEVQK